MSKTVRELATRVGDNLDRVYSPPEGVLPSREPTGRMIDFIYLDREAAEPDESDDEIRGQNTKKDK